ncbi:hypothetical protein L6452_34931 [Arctium lappa]|uniref:Uncharacterized protein n=1 Tax=Arctium lappa TaxID=4217 RepID=A0ACB8YKN5_ARCLA|nr:hypothetical protein L6452_34931 [Arctium lappa]
MVTSLFQMVRCMKLRETRQVFVGNWYGLDEKNTSVQMEDLDELPFFSLCKVAKATDNFSINNKIREGGFGPVYKVFYLTIKVPGLPRWLYLERRGVSFFVRSAFLSSPLPLHCCHPHCTLAVAAALPPSPQLSKRLWLSEAIIA